MAGEGRAGSRPPRGALGFRVVQEHADLLHDGALLRYPNPLVDRMKGWSGVEHCGIGVCGSSVGRG